MHQWLLETQSVAFDALNGKILVYLYAIVDECLPFRGQYILRRNLLSYSVSRFAATFEEYTLTDIKPTR